MTDNELYQMIIKTWGTLHECPACGETGLSINLDGEENCLMCGYEYEPEDDDSEEWYCAECERQFKDEDDFNSHIGLLYQGDMTNPPEYGCITEDDDSRYDNWKDNQR
jgi:ribosomal protein L37AE/L43A